MPWTPESVTPLTSSTLSAIGLEETAMKLWYEFLSGYFNGQSHVFKAGDAPVPFPVAVMLCQRGRTPQPLEGVAISILHLGGGKTRILDVEQSQGYNKTAVDFLVRSAVKAKRDDGHNAESLTRTVSDLLYALFTHEHIYAPLKVKGISQIRMNQPRLVDEVAEYTLRSLSSRATYRFNRLTTGPGFGVSDSALPNAMFRFKDGQYQTWDEGYAAQDITHPWAVTRTINGQVVTSQPIAN
jgi:hypothetical protein